MKEIVEKITELRHDLHGIPEESMQETKTKQMLENFLTRNTKLEIEDRGRWFCAVKRGAGKASGKQPIAFRADMDAVCGKDGKPGHYCGHDGHAAALAGFALWLDRFEPAEDIYLIFQPAEETGKGAELCSALLEEKHISHIFGQHNIPGYPKNHVLIKKGTFACASTGLEITMRGVPSHAGYPEAGRNPGCALAQLLLDTRRLTERYNREKGFVLMTLIGLDVGSANYGVSASEGVLRMTVRGERESVFEEYVNEIRAMAEAAAARDGLELYIQEIERFPATENYDDACEMVRLAAEENKFAITCLEEPMRWSEDFGGYLKKTAGAFFGIGDGENYPQLHTQDYEFPDEVLETAIKMFAAIATIENKK